MPVYHGRRSRRKKFIMGVVFFVLLVFIVVALTAFFVQEHMIFNSEGFRFESLFGIKSDEEEGNGQNISYPPPLIDIEKTEEDDPLPEKENIPAGLEQIHSCVLINPEDIRSFLDNADETTDAYAIDVKPADGRYLIPNNDFPTDEQRAVASVLPTLEQTHKIAVTSVMLDNEVPRQNQELALRTAKSVLWLDSYDRTWFNPYVDNIDVYCSNIIDNCVKAGFNQIILRDFQFCTMGKTNLISYGEVEDTDDARISRITRIAQEIYETFEKQDVVISILLTETAAKELIDPAAGQNVALLARYCHMLYIPVDADELAELDLTAIEAAISGTSCRIGLYISGEGSLPEGMEYHRIYVN